MEAIEYTAKAKKELFTYEWNGHGDRIGQLRVAKMVRPICDQGCQGSIETTVLGWWETCKHGPVERDGSPYWRMRQHVKKVDTYEPVLDAEGNPTGEFTGTKATRMFFTLEPNVTEVVYAMSHNSGHGVEDAQRIKGFKLLGDVSIAPMCELKACGKAWPTVRTEFGDYCSVAHAKWVGMRLQQEWAVENSPKRTAEILRDNVRI